MNKTKIEWVQNPDNKTLGFTWNPITGCLNHIAGMCKGGDFPCYACRLANGRLRERYLRQQIFPVGQFDDEFYTAKPLDDPFYPRFWPERLWLHELVGSKRKPKGIFVCDMSDLFGIGVPEDWTRRVLDVIKKHPRHRFYLLTKQPQNLIKWSPFPDNCWVGVTVTNRSMLQPALEGLADIIAVKRFLSFEPMLEQINLTGEDCELLDWLIIGAQTKPYKPPAKEGVKEIVDAADKAGIPVFLKDNLLAELPMSIKTRALAQGCRKLRQEMPK